METFFFATVIFVEVLLECSHCRELEKFGVVPSYKFGEELAQTKFCSRNTTQGNAISLIKLASEAD